MKHYDVIVIGAGSGNIVLDAALKKGLQCAQIEKGRFGGACLTRGCIPTKVMITAADYVREISELPKIGVEVAGVHMNWNVVSQRVWQKINESKDILAAYQSEAKLDVYQGTGYFVKEKVMQVAMNDGTVSDEITADKIFIAAGSRTKITSIPGLSEVGYVTSESFFGERYPQQPYKSLIILGGGPIGTEFAHIFSAIGTRVTVIQRNVRLLAKEDQEISDQILRDIRKLGIEVYLNTRSVSVRIENGDKVLTVADISTGELSEVRAEEIMIASGIIPATEALQLENTTIETDRNGWIRANEFLETNVPGIWAFGDINGQAPFRHKANYEAEIVAHNLFGGYEPCDWRWARYDLVPVVTYTYPQVGHVGLTEQQAIEAGFDIVTAKHYYSSTAKGFSMGLNRGDEHDGFVKIVVDRWTNKFIGVHIIGPQASILLQPFINLMNAGVTRITPINEDIGSDIVKKLRVSGLTRNLDPHSVISVGETMAPHPSLAEVAMWTQYYFEGK